MFIFINIKKIFLAMWIGDCVLVIGDWSQSPIPIPQSPIPNPQSPNIFVKN